MFFSTKNLDESEHQRLIKFSKMQEDEWYEYVKKVCNRPGDSHDEVLREFLIEVAINMRPKSIELANNDDDQFLYDSVSLICRIVYALDKQQKLPTAKTFSKSLRRIETTEIVLCGDFDQVRELLRRDFARSAEEPSLALTEKQKEAVNNISCYFKDADTLDRRASEMKSRNIQALQRASRRALLEWTRKESFSAWIPRILKIERWILSSARLSLQTFQNSVGILVCLFVSAFGLSVLFPFLSNLLIYGMILIGVSWLIWVGGIHVVLRILLGLYREHTASELEN